MRGIRYQGWRILSKLTYAGLLLKLWLGRSTEIKGPRCRGRVEKRVQRNLLKCEQRENLDQYKLFDILMKGFGDRPWRLEYGHTAKRRNEE